MVRFWNYELIFFKSMEIEKHCLQCGAVLPDYEPANKQYCNDACKQSAYRERLEGNDDEDQEAADEDEGGLHPLAWLGMFGIGIWLFNANAQTRNKAVTTRSVPSIPPTLKPL